MTNKEPKAIALHMSDEKFKYDDRMYFTSIPIVVLFENKNGEFLLGRYEYMSVDKLEPDFIARGMYKVNSLQAKIIRNKPSSSLLFKMAVNQVMNGKNFYAYKKAGKLSPEAAKSMEQLLQQGMPIALQADKERRELARNNLKAKEQKTKSTNVSKNIIKKLLSNDR